MVVPRTLRAEPHRADSRLAFAVGEADVIVAELVPTAVSGVAELPGTTSLLRHIIAERLGLRGFDFRHSL